MTRNLIILELALVDATIWELESTVTVPHVVSPTASVFRTISIRQNTVVGMPFIELIVTIILGATRPSKYTFAVSLISKPLSVVPCAVLIFIHFVHKCQSLLRFSLVAVLNLNCCHY